MLAAAVAVILWAPSFELTPSPPFTWIRLLREDVSTPDAFTHFNIPVGAIGVWLAWLVGVLGVGEVLSARLLPRLAPPEERLVTMFACGLTGLGLLTVLVGLFAANTVTCCVIVALAALLGLARAEAIWAALRATLSPFFSPVTRRSVVWQFMLGFALLALLGGFLYALLAPTQSDGMRYHLAAPQEYLKAGRIVYLPDNAFSNFPFLPEMHFLLALGCGTPVASQLMHWSTFLAVGLALLAFCRRFVEPMIESELEDGGLVILVPFLVYACAPMAFILAGWPFVDHSVTFFVITALYGLLIAFETGSYGTYVLAGALLGAAIGCKYTVIPFAVVFGVIAICEWIAFSPPPSSGRKRSITFPKLLTWAVVACVVSAVWFAKNFACTRNPVYPLAHSLLGGGEWNPEAASFLASRMATKGVPKTLANLAHPLAGSTFDWMRYEQHFPGAWILITLVAGAPGLVFAWVRHGSRSRFAWYCAVAAAAWYVLWFFTYQSNRMLLPMIALLAPAVTLFAADCRARSFLAHVVLTVALATASVHGLLWSLKFEFTGASPPTIPYLIGSESRDKYMSRALSYWYPFEYLNEHMKPGETALLVGEHRIYGAKFQAVWSDWFDAPVFLRLARQNKISTADQFIDLMKAKGIRWMLHNAAELSLQKELWRSRFSDDEWQLLNEVLRSDRLRRTDIPPGVHIFEVLR